MLSFAALSVSAQAFGDNEIAATADHTPTEVTTAVQGDVAEVTQPAEEAPAVMPISFSDIAEAEPVAEAEIYVVAPDEEMIIAPTYTPINPESTRIVASSEPMNHEVEALNKIQEQYSYIDDAREAQYQYTLAREAGMYFEPRIVSARQLAEEQAALELAAAESSKKTKAASADNGKDKRYGSGGGIKGGMVVSQFDMNYDGAPMKIGYTAGIFAEHIFSNNIGLGAELNFTQVSAQTYYNENSFTGDFNVIETTTLNYVTIPLLVKYNKLFVQGLAIEAGIQLGFLVGGSVKTEYPAYKTSSALPTDYNTFDLGLPIGLSYTLKNGLTFGARYVLGLSTTLESKSYKNRMATITAGYRF